MSFAKKQNFVQETFDIYNDIEIKNYIDLEMKKNSKKWIYEVLKGEREKKDIVFENEHYVFLPNNISVQKNFSFPMYLNMLVLFKDNKLKSLRDLRGDHISLLEETMKNCLIIIQDKYNIEKENIIGYFHYPPSVYQLHLHIVTKQYCRVGDLHRFHNINTVISNLKLDSDYYTKVQMSFPVNINSNLYFAMQKTYLNGGCNMLRPSLNYASDQKLKKTEISQSCCIPRTTQEP